MTDSISNSRLQRCPLGISLRCLAVVSGLFIADCSTGSNDEVPRSSVSGKVTFNAEPVPYGLVRFVPQPGTDAPVYTAHIQDGEYTAETRGGVQVGKYRVEIVGWHHNPEPTSVTETETSGNEQYIPAKFNTESSLEAEIVSTEPQQFDFELK